MFGRPIRPTKFDFVTVIGLVTFSYVQVRVVCWCNRCGADDRQ